MADEKLRGCAHNRAEHPLASDEPYVCMDCGDVLTLGWFDDKTTTLVDPTRPGLIAQMIVDPRNTPWRIDEGVSNVAVEQKPITTEDLHEVAAKIRAMGRSLPPGVVSYSAYANGAAMIVPCGILVQVTDLAPLDGPRKDPEARVVPLDRVPLLCTMFDNVLIVHPQRRAEFRAALLAGGLPEADFDKLWEGASQ